jgi:ribose 5-phosphate isomerase B
MKIIIGGDHAGFQLKEEIKGYLTGKGVDVVDAGNTVYDAKDDYPDFALAVANRVASGEAGKGIIICGSGVGASIAANKVKGVRACLCHDTYSAGQGVEHDDMNVLCLGGRIVGGSLAQVLVDAFIKAEFSREERHQRRLDKVLAQEQK